MFHLVSCQGMPQLQGQEPLRLLLPGYPLQEVGQSLISGYSAVQGEEYRKRKDRGEGEGKALQFYDKLASKGEGAAERKRRGTFCA